LWHWLVLLFFGHKFRIKFNHFITPHFKSKQKLMAQALTKMSVDANDSGQLDIADPIYLLDYLFGTKISPPAPFPESGYDITEDVLDCKR
jgi:hypothetical protein